MVFSQQCLYLYNTHCNLSESLILGILFAFGIFCVAGIATGLWRHPHDSTSPSSLRLSSQQHSLCPTPVSAQRQQNGPFIVPQQAGVIKQAMPAQPAN